MIKRTPGDVNYPQTARCSKCNHVGTLFVNDDVVRQQMNENFKHIFGKVIVARFFLFTTAVFVWGLALGAWLIP